MAEVEALILAAGRGERMGPQFQRTQKCILPIDGKPLLVHILEALKEAFGSVDARVAIGYKGQDVIECLQTNRPNKVRLSYIHGSDNGVTGAYRNAEPFLNGDFVSLPGDVLVYPEAYVQVLELFESQKPDVAIAFSPQTDVVDSHGVGKLNGSRVIEFSKLTPVTPDADHLRCLTIYASGKSLYNLLRKYDVPDEGGLSDLFTRGVKELSLAGVRYELPWLHLGYPQDLNKVLAPKV